MLAVQAQPPLQGSVAIKQRHVTEHTEDSPPQPWHLLAEAPIPWSRGGQGPSSFQVFGTREVEQLSVVLSPCICGDLLHDRDPSPMWDLRVLQGPAR